MKKQWELFFAYFIFASLTACTKATTPDIQPGVVLDEASNNFVSPSVLITLVNNNVCANGQVGSSFTVTVFSKTGSVSFTAEEAPIPNHPYELNQNGGKNWVSDSSSTMEVSSDCVDSTCSTAALPPGSLPGAVESSDLIAKADIHFVSVAKNDGETTSARFGVTYPDGNTVSGTLSAVTGVSSLPGNPCAQ
jgi:hypothetical protein